MSGEMKVSEVLRGAAALLLEKGWTRGQMARKADGTPTDVRDPDAELFCAVGAINRAAGTPRDDARRMLATAVDNPFVASEWNDHSAMTKEHVIHGLDAAYILALQEEGLEPEDVL